jgi:sortase A
MWRRLPLIVPILGLLVFLFWVLTVLLPVLVVEVKYQTKQGLERLGFTSLVSVFRPDFSGFTIVGNASKNKDYGIVIPNLGIDEPVVFNVDPNDEQQYRAALKEGIAHASSTAFPGSAGVAYYFAHSSTPEFRSQYNAIFYLINRLEVGDEIYIWHEQQRFKYAVTDKKITTPEDLSFLQLAVEGEEKLVLQTCWPPGTTRQRLLVFAERAL